MNTGSLQAQQETSNKGTENKMEAEVTVARSSEPERLSIQNPDRNIIKPNDEALIKRAEMK